MKTPPVPFEPAPSTSWPTSRRGRRQKEQFSSIAFAIRFSGHHLTLVTKLCLVTHFFEALLRVWATARWHADAKHSFATLRYQAELGNESDNRLSSPSPWSCRCRNRSPGCLRRLVVAPPDRDALAFRHDRGRASRRVERVAGPDDEIGGLADGQLARSFGQDETH